MLSAETIPLEIFLLKILCAVIILVFCVSVIKVVLDVPSENDENDDDE